VLYLKDSLSQGKAFKIFTIYLVGTVLVQISAQIYLVTNGNNLFISHYYFIGQFILLGLFFKSLFESKIQRTLSNWILVIGISVIVIHYAIEPDVFFRFNLFEIFVTSFLIIILASIHLYNLLGEEKKFYYSTVGILLYLSGSTILFFVGNLTVILSKEYQFLPWTLNAALVVIYQLFILVQWRKIIYSMKIKIHNDNQPT
jgi:hypothetical protein